MFNRFQQQPTSTPLHYNVVEVLLPIFIFQLQYISANVIVIIRLDSELNCFSIFNPIDLLIHLSTKSAIVFYCQNPEVDLKGGALC